MTKIPRKSEQTTNSLSAYLDQRGVSLDLLKQQKLPRDLIVPWNGEAQIVDKEYRKKNKLDPDPTVAGVPHKPLQGALMRYQKCSDGRRPCRVRWFGSESERTHGGERDEIDMKITEATTASKWESSTGDAVPYLRCCRSDRTEHIITEAPFKTLAVAQYGFSAIGMASCDSGLHIEKTTKLNSEARRVRWREGVYFILADSGQMRNPLVANGVGRAAMMTAREGADIRICYLPERKPLKGEVVTDKSFDWGIDDYQSQHYKRWKALVHAKLTAKAAAAEVDGLPSLTDGEIDRRAEAAGRLRAQRMIKLVLLRAVPGNPLERVRQERERGGLDRLVHDPIFQACLKLATPTETTALARAWGRGAKSLFSAAASEFNEAVAAQEKEERADYEVIDGSTCFQGTPVCNFSAQITEEVVKDDGLELQREYRIHGKLADGADLHTVTVPADDYRGMGWTSQWSSRACIAAGRTAQEHVRAAIQTLSTPTTRTVFTQTGWRKIGDQHVYLLPGGGIGPDGLVEVDCDVVGRYSRPALPATQEEEQEALLTSLRMLRLAPERISYPLLAMTYLPALRPLLPDGLDFTWWLYGQTGSKKSCAAGVAQSHYGNFSYTNLPGNWNDTVTTLEKHSSVHADALWTVDNLVPPKTAMDQKAMTSKCNAFVQGVGDGQGRGRQTRDLKDRKRFAPRAGVLSTAEFCRPQTTSRPMAASSPCDLAVMT